MRLFSYILFYILICSACIGQQRIVIHGVVKNPEGEIVPDVKVFLISNSKKVYRTNRKGEYFISVDAKIKTDLIFNHVGYKQKIVSLPKKVWRRKIKDTLYVNVKLKYPELSVFVVGGKQKPKIVFGSETSSINDFEFYNDKLVLLSYQKSLTKNALIKLVDYNQQLIAEYNAPDNAIKLFKDYENKLYLITETKTFLISIVKNAIRLRPIDKKLFNTFTSKIIDTLSSNLLYANFNANYPAFNYFVQAKYDTNATVIHQVKNDFMMNLYRAEFKYVSTKEKLWAYRQELKTGIDKEVWIGASSFTQSLYYEPLYAPLFVTDDTILIFDHYSNHLYKIDDGFTKVDSIPISYHKQKDKKNWEQPLLKDKEKQKVYALFKRGGYYYLKDLDLQTGKPKTAFKLYYRFVENVKVKDGYVYYIYRPFESTQRKFLYRELLVEN